MLTVEKLDNMIAEMHKRREKEEREYDGHRLSAYEWQKRSKVRMYVLGRSIEVDCQTAFGIMLQDYTRSTADWSKVLKKPKE